MAVQSPQIVNAKMSTYVLNRKVAKLNVIINNEITRAVIALVLCESIFNAKKLDAYHVATLIYRNYRFAITWVFLKLKLFTKTIRIIVRTRSLICVSTLFRIHAVKLHMYL
jgi:hypothetical protein